MCFWTSLVGVEEACSSDEFWLWIDGALVTEGSFGFWDSAYLRRMSVMRSAAGTVLSYAPSLSDELPQLDWSPAYGHSSFTPSISGPAYGESAINAWDVAIPYYEAGALTISSAGSRTSTVLSITSNGYGRHGAEVLWRG